MALFAYAFSEPKANIKQNDTDKKLKNFRIRKKPDPEIITNQYPWKRTHRNQKCQGPYHALFTDIGDYASGSPDYIIEKIGCAHRW